MEAAAESVQAKILARLVMPVLGLIVLPLIGFVAVRAVGTVDTLVTQVNTIDKRTEVMDERQKNYVLRQQAQNTAHLGRHDDELQDHEKRIETLERLVPTP